MPSLFVIKTIVVLMLMGVVTGCVSMKAPPGKVRFRDWWNFYEFGTAELKSGKLRSAQEAFETCLGVRPGAKTVNPNSAWRTRKYGLHMLHDYFPHRELGVSLHLQGRSREALKYLEESLRREPSGRARHYYNEAQAALLAATPATQGPVLVTVAPPAVTNQQELNVTGMAKSEGLIRRAKVAGREIAVEQAQKVVKIAQRVPLREGLNTIELSAEDLRGGRTNVQHQSTADWTPPEVSVEPLRSGTKDLRVHVKDAVGIRRIDHGTQTILETQSQTQNQRELEMIMREGEPRELEVEDVAGNVRSIDLAGAEGLSDPSIHLPGIESQSSVRSYRDRFFLDMELDVPEGIAAVRLNGNNILSSEQQGRRWVYLGRMLDLNEGPNEIFVELEGVEGSNVRRDLLVEYHLPVYMDPAHRLRCELTGNTAPETLEREIVSSQTARAFVRSFFVRPKRPRFQLLNTNPEVLEKILLEQKLNNDDLADKKARLRLSQELDAELLMVLQVYEYRQGHTVRIEVFNRYTTKNMFDTDVYLPTGMTAEMKDQMEGLVSKIERGFPQLQGGILNVGRNQALLDINQNDGALVGHRFLVLRPEGESIEAARLVQAEGEAVQVELSKVRARNSTGRIGPTSSQNQVLDSDVIVAR